MKIDNVQLFKSALTTGINLFTGAGFSVLEAPDGSVIPNSEALCEDICRTFSIDTRYSSDLERLTNIVNQRARQQFQEYLREKYRITKYNELYDALNKINIHSYITTNIDNLIQCVMDNSACYSLYDITVYGAKKSSVSELMYVPLHGEVNNPNANLYFGKSELANVDTDNKDLFDIMHSKLLEAPTLFWGYGFHDNAVERTIAKLLDKHKHDIWVMCRSGDKNIDYFRDLGCFVIESDTREMLEWIKKEDFLSSTPRNNYKNNPLMKYSIPSSNNLLPVSLEDYFCVAKTDWYCIYYNYACKTTYVDQVREKVLESKNVIITGIPFSGKSTLLMQVALNVSSEIKVFLQECTQEVASTIIRNLRGQNGIVFLENCCADAEATKLFLNEKNISVVGVSDDFMYESSKHIFMESKYVHLEISDLSRDVAQRIYENIPSGLRRTPFTFSSSPEEKISMFEFMGKNIKGILTKKNVGNMLNRIRESISDGFDIIALTTYLSENNSALSMDVLFSYFHGLGYENIRRKIDEVSNYLNNYDVPLVVDEIDQDYYILRSHLFLEHVSNILQKDYKKEYGDVIRRFILTVSPYKIYNMYIFKRTAYDAKLMYSLFDNSANPLYEKIYSYEDSEYTLQQWALYKAKLKDYASAFADIDKAINKNPHNFSIKNSRAIILFEASKEKYNAESLDGMTQAMGILEQCFQSDKRKIYHIQKYAEFAIFLAEHRNEKRYLKNAEAWLKKLIDSGESNSKTTRKLLQCMEMQERYAVQG